MRKRFLSWLLVLTMVTSLIPSTLVTALAAELPSVQAVTSTNGKTTYELTNTWPTNEQLAQYDIVDVHITSSVAPGATVTVKDGQTLIFHGTGFLAGSSTNLTPLIVESGGHLVLDELTIQNNGVASTGAVYVKSGGLLDLGYNDRSSRHAPSITGNTVNATARNLVVADGATVRLNAEATKKIGIYYGDNLGAPFAIVQSGRYTLQNTDLSASTIFSDNTTYKFSINYGDIYIQRVTPKVLFIDPGARATATITNVVAQGNYVFRPGQSSSLVSNLQVAVRDTFNGTHARNIVNSINADVVSYEYDSPANTDNTKGTYAFDNIDNIMQYDVILINGAWGNLTSEGRQKLIDYLNAGGAIYFQAEDTQAGFDGVRAATNRWMQNLGAAGFEAMSTPSGAGKLEAWYDNDNSTAYAKRLTENMTAKWHVEWTAPIKTGEGIEPIFMAKFLNQSDHMWGASFLAGERKDGAKYGRLLTVTDGNWVSPGDGADYHYQARIAGQFFTNLLRTTRDNRVTAAAGYNPNAEVTYEATTTTTTTTKVGDYRTPYAALQKAVENNTVTLLTKTNKAVTPVSNELLFEKSTLAYEAGSTYADSTIHADTAGVYIDITKTGEVNLRSGTVTVAPNSATYPLVLNGTMDQDGNAITGGYKITAATKYQLIADDPTSPILPQNGGKASIVIPNAGESVTVDYGGGKTVTYTAKEANEKVYLGWYQVKKQTPANMTWTDADKAWHGHTFTTTLEPNVGYEINGENLTIADTDNAMTGGYTLKKQGDAATDPNDNTISWTTYSTDDGKVTVKQQHLHSGGSDRNGIAILTVNDVHADISIGAGNNTVNAKAPTIYVVGIGKRTDHADVQLWEYTTVRNTKDGIMDKPVSGWPWEKWKVSSAASGNGTESDYKQNKVTLNSDATKLDTSSETAQYTINMETGDKVVVFYYDWNMVNVTIKATDAKGNPIPDYTDQVVEYESNKKTTITAPNLIGYQPVGGQNTKDFTPSETNKEITFQYEKTTGNLIYKAVYVDGAGVDHDLGTFSGGTLVKGQAPNKAGTAAPTFDNYELVDASADGTATSAGDATKFDGTNDITVTYKYQPKTKDIAVYAYAGDENGQILNLDKTSYKGITTGQTITITAPEIAGYKVKGDASKTFFISNNKSENQDVKFFYEKDTSNNAYVLVKLVDSSNGDKLISSYQVPGVKDKAQLIKAPAAPYGYKNDPNHTNQDQTVTPTGPKAPYKAEVVFKYVPNVHTVTIELKDVSETPAKPLTVNNYVTSYKVVDSEGLTITAPSIYGYTMAKNSESVKVLTNITEDKTVTFEYEPIDKQLVTVHVKGVGPDGKTLFESRETVTHGTASKEVTVFTLPGLKLASAMVGTEDKIADVANGKLNVSLTGVAKGGTVDVVLNYESNMANVTVKAMYNGKELQSYTTSLEKGVQATINAPSIEGYSAKPQSQTVTPGDDPAANTVTFTYTKDKGNVTVVVVDANGNQELYRKDGGTVTNGSKIALTGSAAAPTVEYYTTPTAPKSVLVNGTTEVKDTLTTYQYDGVGDIIVTYEYTRKTQDVTIIKMNVATGAKIDEQQLLGLEVGKSRTFTDGSVTVPHNYEAVADRNPTSYFVEDKTGQTVTFWYKNTSADQYAQVKVDLICDGKVFQSYPVTAIKGQPTTIQAPTWTGYELKAGTQASKTVTPDGTAANDKVEFEYTITNPKTVTVVLKDNSNSTNPKLNAPANYIDSYTLKMGDNVTIWAPAIDGYSLVSATLGDKASDNKQMVQAEYGKLADGTTTVTFAYMPVSQANFVTHTVRFMLGDKELYSYDKKVDKGTGNVVSYPADAVKSMIPGYTYDHTSYLINGVTAQAGDVKDNVNATIIYHFAEDTARITIKFQDASGNELMQNGVKVPDQELTGYRKGQTVQVAAPVKEGFALVSNLIQSVTLNDANTDVVFKYAAAGDVTFTLKELNADGTEGSIIAVINGEASKTYDANAKDGNPLDLSQYGYTYEPSNLATEPFKVGGPGKVENPDMSKKTAYTVFYTKNLITVEFVPVNKTELDKANKSLDSAILDGTAYSTYKITELHPETPEKARVGETYKAVAQSFNGWALKDSYSKQYKVEAGDTSLKVYFLYEQKTTGTVTVHYHFGTGADNMGEKLNEYTITAVAGEKLKISAPEYLLDNKYHLRTTNTNPCILTVTENTETVDFYYEANFVTITTKVNLDGTDTGTHETYEVIKNINITPNSGSTTLYPPEKAGYTLIGITADGATLTNGGADKLPTQYTNNKLDLKGLTTDATVTYYYKTTKASEYQTELTVEYKYNGYDLATAKKINANTGEANSIDIPAFDGYTASTYNFTDGSTVKVNGSGVNGTTVSVTPAEKTATLTITYTRPDGSIVLPGKGDKIGDSDDIIVKPTDPNTPPTLNPDNGSVTIPKDPAGNTGTVTRPKDPTKPADGKEDIIVPGGTTIDKDGTIHLPDGGGDIKPDQKIPDALPDTYVAITYDSNNGSGDVKKEIGKKGELKVADSLFTHPTNAKFEGWNDSGLGSGTAYAKDKTVDTSITLYAKWSANYKYHATITYKPNDGTTGKDVLQNVGHDTDPNLKATLQSNTFQISGWLFGGWNEEANGTGELRQSNDTWNLSDKDAKTLYAQWYKVNADGSITVPGKDGNPKNEDTNATAKGNGTDAPTRNDKGEIEVPKGGSVTLPDGSVIGMPDGGKLLPNGTVIINRPEDKGTITIPGANGTNPDVTDKDGQPETNATVIELVYQINDGKSPDEVTVKVVKGDTVSILDCPFTWAGHQFVNWMGTDNKEYASGANYTAGDNDLELHAQWVKVNDDGSIELPGKDGSMTTPKDNVLVTPDKPNGTVTKQPDGSVKVEDNGGTVTRPTDPKHPENGKEEIKVPEGTVVEPDGTIKLPDGTVIDPDKRVPDDVAPTDYYVVTYEPGDGSGDVIRDVIKKDADTTLRDEDTFTAPNGKTFDGWLDGAQTKYDAGTQLTVSESMTLTAQWKDGTPTPPAPKYSATIVFDPNTGDATATQTVTSADSATITRNFDAYTQHFTAPAGWTFMGWSTTQVASQSSSFYADGAEETLKDGDSLNLYAILYKLDVDTKVITLPGKGGQPEGGDDVTVTPGAGADLTVDKGFIKAPAGSEIKQPANATPIKVIEGEVNVYPDGTVYVPEGSKVQLPDGSEIKGETTVDPDGTPDADNTKPVQKPDGTIVLPGKDGTIGTGGDDITIAPAGPNQPAGRIDKDGKVTITNPSGADVNIPGSNPADFKVPNGTIIEPNGNMTLLYTIRYVDGSGTEIKTATVKSVQRGIPEPVEAATITGYTVSGEATKTASGEVSANLADYTITFNYTKNSSGGGSSSGGGGGGSSSTVSSYTIKASAGANGTISPNGSVSVARGKDQTFTISAINGYRIADVLVDGKSVGNVSTYTFENVKANHTIEAKFVKQNSIIADPTETGVAGWLQTSEHIAYLGGYGNGKFGPTDCMTRAQAAQMFYNLLLNKNVDITVKFTDVPADAWYGNAVHTLASLGIIKGIGNDQFAPNRTITRAEFAVIAMRFANLSTTVTNPFTDIASNDWYYSAVTSAVSYGWITGYSDGTFRPYATITRAEVATIVNRMLARTADRDFVDSSAVTHFDDVPNTYWAYYSIAEATNAHTHTINNDGVESWGKLK